MKAHLGTQVWTPKQTQGFLSTYEHNQSHLCTKGVHTPAHPSLAEATQNKPWLEKYHILYILYPKCMNRNDFVLIVFKKITNEVIATFLHWVAQTTNNKMKENNHVFQTFSNDFQWIFVQWKLWYPVKDQKSRRYHLHRHKYH